MKKMLLVIALVFSCSLGFTQDFKLTGNETPIPAGELVMAKVVSKDSLDRTAKGFIYDWKVLEINPHTKLIVEKTRIKTDKNELYFGGGLNGGTVKIIVSVSYGLPIIDKDGKLVDFEVKSSGQLASDFQIEGFYPTPKPNPEPTPGPIVPPKPDTIPDGDLGLIKKTYDLALQVNTDNQPATVKAIASNYKGMAAAIAAGTKTNVKQIFEELKVANQNSLAANSSSPAHWQAFNEGLSREIYNLFLAKKLDNITNYVEVFNEVGDGLLLTTGK